MTQEIQTHTASLANLVKLTYTRFMKIRKLLLSLFCLACKAPMVPVDFALGFSGTLLGTTEVREEFLENTREAREGLRAILVKAGMVSPEEVASLHFSNFVPPKKPDQNFRVELVRTENIFIETMGTAKPPFLTLLFHTEIGSIKFTITPPPTKLANLTKCSTTFLKDCLDAGAGRSKLLNIRFYTEEGMRVINETSKIEFNKALFELFESDPMILKNTFSALSQMTYPSRAEWVFPLLVRRELGCSPGWEMDDVKNPRNVPFINSLIFRKEEELVLPARGTQTEIEKAWDDWYYKR